MHELLSLFFGCQTHRVLVQVHIDASAMQAYQAELESASAAPLPDDGAPFPAPAAAARGAFNPLRRSLASSDDI